MSIIEINGWQSHFSAEERSVLLNLDPVQIALRLIEMPDLALRHLQELIANNQPQLALSALNSIFPIGKRQQLINEWAKKLPEEFAYYTEYDMPAKEKEWHSFEIPFILALAANNFEAISVPAGKRLGTYMAVREQASRVQEAIRQLGLLR
jgi:hypothetical protein